ncbi:hypothetical protein OEIGOIKO_03559 [Streptomyces chrestomyceticus JCM 4735]|uniref:Uncharacterized protein n=1 Tax=Streptomyces chrestomyceticus JCM 4735 TaxID=1306181 RepID=A0A7U9PWY4_9ACTN|nr:hypothetical protein [Streptomyces chrestomyceticus]GCD35812.1 hypothetical protein OEIGOIKO_03559 [Streptomyces chrestomyceticus JCM 4735]
MTTAPPSRAWTVTISSPAGRPLLMCSACPGPDPAASVPRGEEMRRHLARHVRESGLEPHLRTCQCRERFCVWHRRQGPCNGALRLVLIRADQGRTWHLADACAACAVAIPQAATVSEPPAPHGRTARDSPATDASYVLEEPGEWTESL